ncbi:MAG: sterol desaturase family protein [Lysobacterales bacterium]
MGPRAQQPLIGPASALHHGLMLAAAGWLWAAAFAQFGWAALAVVVAGWSAHSLIAYAIHRFVLHGRGGRFVRSHAQHHASPLDEVTDLASYLAPMAIILVLWALVDIAVGSRAVAHGVAAGLCLGYSWFRLVHRLLHRLVHLPRKPAFVRRYVEAHSRHHRDPRVNFSVTFPLWDRVLGTQHPQGRKANPASGSSLP